MTKLPDDFPEVTHEELLETIDEVFRTGANEIPPEEIFGDNFEDVPTTL